ncbi:MAG: hypothetical protein IH838_06105 [Proteobacteria bacterium]|nr:hypothetical protein [Pseudomonadota bacterium]
MRTSVPKLSDAETFRILERAQEQYAQYVKLSEIEIEPNEARPVYSSDNPIGLVINAYVE